ncbi:MAG: hypothetical protein ACRD45_13755, partial [Bryobacteraceae bacterium]
MPNLSVNVVMYAKLAGGKRRYRRPATSPDGRLKLWYAVVDGQPEYHPEALYYLQYREHGVLKYDRLPPDPAAMLAAERRKQQILELSAEGLVVLGPAPVALTDPMRPSKDIAAAAAARATSVASGPSARARIDEFLAETAKRRKPKTYDAYASALK